MDSPTLRKRLNEDLGERKTIILLANCQIEYWGRSRSMIGEGDRIILFKPDSTLIVHSPAGFKPVNWMSSPTDTQADLVDGKVVLFSQRTVKPFEEMKVKIEDVISYLGYLGLKDSQKLDLTHTEKDMRDYLAENTDQIHPDFRLKSVEYKSPLGLFDLYGKIGDKYAVVELKSVRAGLPAVLQLKRYRDWLSEKLRQEVLGILMAPSIASNSLNLLKKEGLTFKKFNVKKIEVRKDKTTLGEWMK